jgi:hypothetical protein
MKTSNRGLQSGYWLDSLTDDTEKQHNFDSFESCYPLTSFAGPLFFEDENRGGIDNEDDSDETIARELFELGCAYPKDT